MNRFHLLVSHSWVIDVSHGSRLCRRLHIPCPQSRERSCDGLSQARRLSGLRRDHVRGVDPHPDANPGLLPRAQSLPPRPLAAGRWRPESSDALNPDQLSPPIFAQLPLERPHLTGRVQGVPDRGGRARADSAAIHRAEPAEGPPRRASRILAVVQPAMVVETREGAREAGFRDGAARLAMDRRSQRVVDRSRGRASAIVHPPRRSLRFAGLESSPRPRGHQRGDDLDQIATAVDRDLPDSGWLGSSPPRQSQTILCPISLIRRGNYQRPLSKLRPSTSYLRPRSDSAKCPVGRCRARIGQIRMSL
jgi:hypothetical protein